MASIARFVDAQTLAIESIVKSLVDALVALWSGVETWNEEGISFARAQSVELVESAQAEARRVVYAHSLPVYQQAGVSENQLSMGDLGLDTPDYPRRGVTAFEVWERPLREYRKKASSGASKQQAVSAALSRVETVADMEVRLAKRDQEARINLASERVMGYRRLIHPELSETGVCGLCVAAATRIYHRGDLSAIHPSCKCTIAPVTRTADPGLHLNDDDLRELYKRAGGTGKSSLSNVRLVDFVSGELGPVLTKEGTEKQYARSRYEVENERAARATKPRDVPEKIEALKWQISDLERIISEETLDLAKKIYERRLARYYAQLSILEKRAA
ncbi:hypothetical protein ACN082_09810 [Rothia sp. CCM 9417]|uniref:hypothetical protein n=1 Tax=Rothia sp. CCM 9417 TaxID=3402657 RepID=UPI003ADEC792